MFTRPTTEIAKSVSHTNEMQEKSGEAVLAFGSSKRKAGEQAGLEAEGNTEKRRRRTNLSIYLADKQEESVGLSGHSWSLRSYLFCYRICLIRILL